VADESSIPPYAPSESSSFAQTLRGAADQVSSAIEAGRRPGMPLSILTNAVREAPLGSLFVAFLIGVAVARRR
jgi:hypothetical protein